MTLTLVRSSPPTEDLMERMTKMARLVPRDHAALGQGARALCGRLVEWEFVGFFDGRPIWRHGGAVVDEADLEPPDPVVRPMPAVLLWLAVGFGLWLLAFELLRAAFRLL